MIDPTLLTTWSQLFTSRRYGRHYRAALTMEVSCYVQFARRRFENKDDALKYGERVIARWIRLYQARARVAGMVTGRLPALSTWRDG